MNRSLLLSLLALSLLFVAGCADEDRTDDDDDDDAGSCAAAVPCIGEYTIENSSDLDELALCEGVTDGDVAFAHLDWLTSIDLPCLTTVGQSLYIDDNDSLTDLDGLSSLTTVGQVVSVRDNTALTNLDGLSGLTTVDGTLDISGNVALTDLDGLSGLTTVEKYLYIDATALTDLDSLSNLTTVGWGLTISFNDALTNLDGLSELTTVGGTHMTDGVIHIYGNSSLCQSLVDAFVAACTSCGPVGWNHNNDDSC